MPIPTPVKKKTSRLTDATKKAIMNAKKTNQLTGAQAKALRSDLRSQTSQKKGDKYSYKVAGKTVSKKSPQSEKKLIKLSGIKKSTIKAQTKRTAAATTTSNTRSRGPGYTLKQAAASRAKARRKYRSAVRHASGSVSLGTQPRVGGLAVGPMLGESRSNPRPKKKK